MKPDKDCIVRSLGTGDYYLCSSLDQYGDKCLYLKRYGFENTFCNYPDRHKLPTT